MTVSLDTLLGVLATLALIALIGSVGVLIHAENLLGRCRDVLGFTFSLAARNDKNKTLRNLDDENERQQIYNKGYSRGYADGEYEGMKRFKAEQEGEHNEQTSTSETSGV